MSAAKTKNVKTSAAKTKPARKSNVSTSARMTPKQIAEAAIKQNPRLKGKAPSEYAKARIRPMLRKMRDSGELKKLDPNAQAEANSPWHVNANAAREVLRRING